MPVSLLSPIAPTLASTVGQAGGAIPTSGVFAVIIGRPSVTVFGMLDRRSVPLGWSVLLVVSGATLAFAPACRSFEAECALLGVAMGNVRSMSAAIVMRLVPERSVDEALPVLKAGDALAAIVAATLGSLVGPSTERRGTLCIVPVAVAAIVWQTMTLPPRSVGRIAPLSLPKAKETKMPCIDTEVPPPLRTVDGRGRGARGRAEYRVTE